MTKTSALRPGYVQTWGLGIEERVGFHSPQFHGGLKNGGIHSRTAASTGKGCGA